MRWRKRRVDSGSARIAAYLNARGATVRYRHMSRGNFTDWCILGLMGARKAGL